MSKTKEEKPLTDIETLIYLKGYREGFYAALKMAWSLAEEMKTKVWDSSTTIVQEYIDKLKV